MPGEGNSFGGTPGADPGGGSTEGGGAGIYRVTPTSGQPTPPQLGPGTIGYGVEPFADPNSMPLRVAVPMNGGNQGTAQVSVVFGTFGSAVYKVYPSLDGVQVLASAELAQLDSTNQVETFTCTTPFFIITLTTAHGSNDNLHRIEGTGLRTGM